jgi:hypothetical protein
MHDVTSAKHTKKTIIVTALQVEIQLNKKCRERHYLQAQNGAKILNLALKQLRLQLFSLELGSFILGVDAAHNPVSVSTLAALVI